MNIPRHLGGSASSIRSVTLYTVERHPRCGFDICAATLWEGAKERFLDDAGEPELLINGEERPLGAEGVGEALESLGARVRVGEATGDLVLGAEVHLGDIGDLSVPACLLDQVDMGVGPTAAKRNCTRGRIFPT